MKTKFKSYIDMILLVIAILLITPVSMMRAQSLQSSSDTNIYLIEYKKNVKDTVTKYLLNAIFFYDIVPQDAEAILRTEINNTQKFFPQNGDIIASAWQTSTGNINNKIPISLKDGSTNLIVSKEKSNGAPLELLRALITFNSIDNPEARVLVKNVSQKIIDAYTVGIYCYDRFGDRVKHYASDTNRFGGLSQTTIKPGQTEGNDSYWTLYGHENTAKITVVLEKVHMTDGTVWSPQENQKISIEGQANR
jgi:hypothetical protein